jgi:hypothetical protein
MDRRAVMNAQNCSEINRKQLWNGQKDSSNDEMDRRAVQ